MEYTNSENQPSSPRSTWNLETGMLSLTSKLTTFQTCFGQYCWTRLPFGLNVSTEIFQRRIKESLEGLGGVICIADDIITHGTDEVNHDKNLLDFLHRCVDVGIKLNLEKLELRKPEITFMGHIASKDGLKKSAPSLTWPNLPIVQSSERSLEPWTT